ncbi:T-cell surface antigen CD2-like [Neolamprologus brichardi]|uniref:T-cell surface antigen CD2-like n=1 Tax=Neolamprologus brichardi TaxID=32507 RepID=UPI0003EBBA1A|nr:T-cell surface antigen CD2-like [Neolamprologus brichardi]
MRTVKKMASAVSIAAFLLCCCFVPSTGSQDDCVYNATGSNFIVPLNYKLKDSESLKWIKDTRVVFYRRQKQMIEGKNDDVDSAGSLKLTQLTKDKSGRYKPEVTNADGINVGDLPIMRLCVLDPVQKPTVTMKCDKTKVTFTCNVIKSENNLQIKWFMVDKKTAEKETDKDLTRLVKDVQNANFFCSVSNRVSSETSQPVQQDCIKSSFPETLFGISIWVFVGGGAGIVLVLILIVIICCIQTKRKRRLRLKDERELRLQWGNQEQQHQHHQHHHHHHQHPNQNHSDQHQHHHPHHHQQQPAGNTGPRQHRSKQPRTQQRPRAPEPANGQPQPNPRRATQASAPAGNGEEQPPPLPQPRKKTPKAPKE